MKSFLKWYTPPGITNSLCDLIESETHTLIVGVPGSGKSVLLNSFIYQLLLDPPEKNRLYLIDLKLVELNRYRKLPHTKGYADSIESANNMLDSAINACMEEYKRLLKKGSLKNEKTRSWIIIDELADLVLYDKKIIMKLQRLLQIGRAAGFKVVASTQLAKADVIPTRLSAMFSLKIALRLTTKTQSRLVIGTADAVNLPRYGSCITLNADGLQMWKNTPYRKEEEINAVIKHWKKQNSLTGLLFG